MQHHGRTAPRFYQAPESAISSTASQDCVLNGKTRSPLPEFGPLQLTKAIAASENHDNVPYKTYKRITVSRSRQNFSSYVTSVWSLVIKSVCVALVASLTEEMAARSIAYHAHGTADSDKFCCYPWLVCHDIKSAVQCSLRLAPTINHLTSDISFTQKATALSLSLRLICFPCQTAGHHCHHC